MKQHFTTSLICSILIFIFNSCGKKTDSSNLLELNGQTMGTFYSVKLVQDKSLQNFSENEIRTSIEQLLEEVNQQMSTYIEDSEISQFNKYQSNDWFTVSFPLAEVVNYSLKISRISDGAFDITVGPLVNLWGFGPEHHIAMVPSEAEIESKLRKTGYKNLSVRLDPPALKKNYAEIFCDLSAVAKGFGVDAIAQHLDSLGVHSYLIEIGGEIRGKGRNHLGSAWKIGISTPDENFGIQKVIQLMDCSVATSGDYRNYFEKNGVRFSHTIDPKTGKPISHNLASVTVIHESCMSADALATAINVMGAEGGLVFAENQKLPVFLLVKGEKGFIEKMTPGFEKILELN